MCAGGLGVQIRQISHCVSIVEQQACGFEQLELCDCSGGAGRGAWKILLRVASEEQHAGECRVRKSREGDCAARAPETMVRAF